MAKLQTILNEAIALLEQAGIENAKREARYLLAHVLGKDLAYLIAYDTDELDDEIVASYKDKLKLRAKHYPFAYIVKQKDFYGRYFKVDERVLIPRPATETLIDLVKELVYDHHYQTVLDLGTGSGAIILTLEQEIADSCKLFASDKSADALAVALENAEIFNSKVLFSQSDWYQDIAGYYDVIVSNPPYIREQDPHLEALAYEPQSALVAGNNGLSDIEIIVAQSLQHLNQNGLLAIEHGYDQKDEVQALFKHYNFDEITTVQDIEGNDRVTYGYIRD